MHCEKGAKESESHCCLCFASEALKACNARWLQAAGAHLRGAIHGNELHGLGVAIQQVVHPPFQGIQRLLQLPNLQYAPTSATGRTQNEACYSLAGIKSG